MSEIPYSQKIMVLSFDKIDRENIESMLSRAMRVKEIYEIAELEEFWDSPGEDAAFEFLQLYEEEIDYEDENFGFDHEFGYSGDDCQRTMNGYLTVKFATRDFVFPEGFYSFSTEWHGAGLDVKAAEMNVREECFYEEGHNGTMGWRKHIGSLYVWTVKYDYENNGS